MRPKSLILLSLALGCGLVATLGINQVMSKGSPVAAPEGEKMEIFVASKEIGLNDLVTAEHVQIEEWPKDRVPADALTDLTKIVGRRANTQFLPGDVVRNGKLLIEGDTNRASTHIKPGNRVVALKVNAESTGGYIVKPGDRVDLMVYLRKDPTLGIDETITKTLLQNVKVFAVGGVISEPEGESTKNYQHITVELTPEEATIFKMASNLGQIDLSVRSEKDHTIVEDTSVKADDLLDKLLGREKKDEVAATDSQGGHQNVPKTDSPPTIPGIDDLAAELNQEFQPQVEDPWTIQVVLGADVKEYSMQKGSWVAAPTAGASFPPATADMHGPGPAPSEDGTPSPDEEFDLNSILD